MCYSNYNSSDQKGRGSRYAFLLVSNAQLGSARPIASPAANTGEQGTLLPSLRGGACGHVFFLIVNFNDTRHCDTCLTRSKS